MEARSGSDKHKMDTIRFFYPIVSKLVSQLPGLLITAITGSLSVREAADIQTKLGLSEKKLPTFKL